MAGAVIGLGLGGAAVAAAKFVASLYADGFVPSGEEVQGWSLDQSTAAPMTIGPNYATWVGPVDALFEYLLFTVQRERWQNVGRLPGPQSSPGDALLLSNGHTFPIPAYLPDEFRWQGINAIQDTTFGPGTGSTSAGGGGSGRPWERFPTYDRRVGAYLVGGDPADRFLILTQLRFDGHPGVNLSSILYDAGAQPIPPPVVGQSPATGAPPPTPTPVPVAHAAKVAAIALAQPANGGAAVTVRTGASTVHDTTVRGQPARWFNGIWATDGRWLDTDAWTTLVWEQNGLLYQLAGQQLPLDELIRVAESLPIAP